MVALAAGVPGNHTVTATPGLYVIRNQPSNNRYIGKSQNLANRFDSRMLTVNEFGLTQGNLAGIDAFYGPVTCYNTPAAAAAAAPLLPPLPVPGGIAWGAAGAGLGAAHAQEIPANVCPAPNYAAHLVVVMIDGQPVNVEYLLIRFFMQAYGGTVTNGQGFANFTNASPNPIHVMVEWANGINTPLAAGHQMFTVPAHTTI